MQNANQSPAQRAGFFDSHAHLADPAFDDDRNDVIARARAAGARGITCVGESPEVAVRAADIAKAHPGFLWFTAGVHPHNADTYDPARDPDRIREFAARGAVAVGECGLDYHYDNSPRPLQRRAFADQLRLGGELRIPVVVHTRDAEQDTIAMLREASAAAVTGVLHCFTGSRELADVAIEAGWYISLSGIITFRSWTDHDLVRSLPAERILVESDSPYLAPVPSRGSRNEPAWVARTVGALADIRDEPVEVTAAATTANAEKFFGVAARPVA